MTRRRFLLSFVLAIALLGAPLAPPPQAEARTTPFRCPPAWSFVPYVAGPGRAGDVAADGRLWHRAG